MRREKYQDERGRWHSGIYVQSTPQMRQEATAFVTAVNEATSRWLRRRDPVDFLAQLQELISTQ